MIMAKFGADLYKLGKLRVCMTAGQPRCAVSELGELNSHLSCGNL